MKISLLIICLLPLLVHPKPTSTPVEPIDNVSVEDVERVDLARPKRSGFNLVSGIKNTLLSGFGRASASLAASSSGSASSSVAMHSSSGGSTGGSSGGHSYEKPHEEEHFDGWSLKKSILNTLFQAVKAITGGVTILKGQLIKGSGYAVSGLGKVIASSGDAVSNVGKKITSSAQLVPSPHGSSHSIHPFAKLSGSLSSGSAGLVSGASSSSSSSGHHTGPSSESFTSFETHNNYGHQSHSSVSAPSAAAYIPPKPSSHYKAQLTSYGSDIESDDFSTDSHFLPTPGKSNVEEASDVLRQILNQKVPRSGHKYNSYQQPTGPVDYEQKKVISQYDIPNDPYPPPFKPLKGNNLSPLYGLPHGHIESVTHSQSIITSFASPLNAVHADSEPHYPPAHDIYRTMAIKLSGNDDYAKIIVG
ncbi:vitellogenin-2 [Toxorhynchites rutilus septentrionalis]|uniref:vitellogenin-2 n=1 Tax=Toxorhynchites rutilus septentrionalis TaxID=329112 RepID=UPI00247A1AD9|nr:vitellogenin-2 [Toxorhynchites rutilus septentrionalis]